MVANRSIENKRSIYLPDVKLLLDYLLNGSDSSRTYALGKLRKIRHIRSLKNDRNRLVVKYGQESTQVLRYDEKSDANNLLIRNLDFELYGRILTPVTNQPGFWQMQGFVRDESLNFHEGLVVRVYPEAGPSTEPIFQVTTDVNGYFYINTLTQMKPCPEEEDVDYTGMTVYLYIYQPDGTQITTEGIPVTVQEDHVDFQEICDVPAQFSPFYTAPSGPGFTATGIADTTLPLGIWTLSGNVSGAPDVLSEEMNVEIYSPDEEIGDLGTAAVDKDGAFTTSIDPQKHPKLFEKKAKVLLRVVDKDKKELYKLRKAMKPKPGKTEKKTIKIKPKKK